MQMPEAIYDGSDDASDDDSTENGELKCWFVSYLHNEYLSKLELIPKKVLCKGSPTTIKPNF